MRMYCLIDLVAEECSPPYLSKNDETAIRAVKLDRRLIHPSIVKNYKLLFLGEFNMETGTISCPTGTPEEVVADLTPYPEPTKREVKI